MPDEQRRPTGTIEARPNPVTPGPGGTCGATMLTWTSAGVEDVEVRVGAPSGPLFASGGASGTARTGEWVSDGTTFFLQDVSDGRELSSANTLSSVCVRLSGIGRARPDEHWRRETQRLEQLSPYEPTTTTLLGQPFEIIDAASFLSMYEEIIEQGIYGFDSPDSQPYILDCGANVGVSLCYFKGLYPLSRIVAFEPNDNAFAALSRNAAAFGWKNVTLVNKAVAARESELPFVHEPSWASRLARATDHSTGTVPTVRLRRYINDRVDLLKLDIEGAETDVLFDCADVLHLVERIVIEYHSFAGEPQRLDRMLALLATAGYRVYIRSVGSGWPLQPFRQRPVDFGMDMQLYVYAFRTPTPLSPLESR